MTSRVTCDSASAPGEHRAAEDERDGGAGRQTSKDRVRG